MSINREWHALHKLAPDASIEERLHWHLQHAANCRCRDIPASIKRELEARGLTGPTSASLK
ncbi:MAG: hypothetical protein EOP02_13245 [Proteobacteria bacterium]|nr:MAG: hypothetical protein EOP02_13245 [Pseudomonadota bacterium]